MHIRMNTHICIYIYIYIYGRREDSAPLVSAPSGVREFGYSGTQAGIHIYIHLYIYVGETLITLDHQAGGVEKIAQGAHKGPAHEVDKQADSSGRSDAVGRSVGRLLTTTPSPLRSRWSSRLRRFLILGAVHATEKPVCTYILLFTYKSIPTYIQIYNHTYKYIIIYTNI